MAEHTPGPWEVRWSVRRYAGQRQGINRCVIGTPKDPTTTAARVAATIEQPADMEVARANADFIVRACNSHDELLAACEVALPLVQAYARDIGFGSSAKEIRQLRVAIAKAKKAKGKT